MCMISKGKKWYKYSLLLISGLILTAVIIFLLKPEIFISDIESYIAKYLSKDKNTSVEIDSIEGNFFTGFRIEDFDYYKDNITISSFEKIEINLKLLNLLFGQIYFKDLIFNEGILNISEHNNFTQNIHFPRFKINNFHLNNVMIKTQKQSYFVNGEFLVTSKHQSLLMEIVNYSLLTDDTYFDSLSGNSGKINYNGEEINFENIQFYSTEYSGELTGKIKTNNKLIFDLNCGLQEFNFESINKNLNIATQDLMLNLTGQINNMDFNIVGNLLLDNDRKYNLLAVGNYTPDLITAEADILEEDELNIQISGNWNSKSENWYLTSKCLGFALPKSINQNCKLTGVIDSYGHAFESLHSTFNMVIKDSEKKWDFSKINGKLYYQNLKLTSLGLIEIEKDSLKLNIENLSYTKDTLTFNSNIEFTDFPFPENTFINVLPGKLSGSSQFNYKKIKDKNHIDGNASFKSISNNNYNIKNTHAEFEIDLLNDQVYSGIIKGYLNNLESKIYNFDKIDYFLNFSQNSINFEYVTAFNSASDTVLIKKLEYKPDIDLSVSDFKSNLMGSKIEFNNLFIYKMDDYYNLDSTLIYFDDGQFAVSGKYSENGKYDIWCDLQNIELKKINQLFNFNQRLTGNSNGSIHITNTSKYPILLSNIYIKDGFIDETKFKECKGKISFRQNRLILSDFILNTDVGNIQADGWMTVNGSLKEREVFVQEDSLDISVEFTNFNFSSLNRYLPWSLESGGEISGSGKINGKASDLEINLTTEIRNPYFDKISGKYLKGSLIYKDSNLYISGMQLITENGKYTATGSLPLIWSLVEMPQVDISNLPLNMMITGKFNEFELLTPYLTNVDSLIGDFSLQLSLDGTYEHPIRSGQIVVIDGKMNILQLSNPIEKISGVGILTNNRMILTNVSATTSGAMRDVSMFDKIQSYFNTLINREVKSDEGEILSVEGVIDFTEFFKPDYTILIKGENVFLKDNYDNFEGYGDVDLTVTGKDTVVITGKYIPKSNQFTIISEFDNSGKIKLKDIQSHPFYKYDIQIPLNNGIQIINSQMDIFMDGFINISAFGNEDFRYSGELNLVDGSFYYNGNEFTNIEGSIVLDPTQFNPEIDLFTTTNIAGEDIDVSMSGSYRNPILVLESVNDYSQSDIIELLLFRDNTSSNVNSGSNPPIESFISNYFENELERNISRYTFLNKFQLNSSGSLLTGFEDKNIDLYVGANISPKVYMNFKRGIFTTNNTFEYEVGYRMNKNMSLVAKIDEENLIHLNYRIRYHYK